MGYKDKIIKKRLFCQSLMTLKDFACSKPELSLENKQAIIGAIALGGSLQTPGPRNKIQTYYHFNYHYTQRGLIRAFSDKLIRTDSEEKQKVKKAICIISSLSSWANDMRDKAANLGEKMRNGLSSFSEKAHNFFSAHTEKRWHSSEGGYYQSNGETFDYYNEAGDKMAEGITA